MKNRKKIIFVGIIVIIIIGFGLFFATSQEKTDVYLKDFEVSADGKTMTLKIGVSNNTGYVRKMKRTNASSNEYYTFYSTYGINSKIGAEDTFKIKLDDDTDEIYFYTGDKDYKLVLTKNKALNNWYYINYADNGKIKINLPSQVDVLKVEINTYAQDNNYFEYSDKETIEKIYNIFDGLETTVPSTTFNPENFSEMYAIFFDVNEDKEKSKYYIDIYRNKNKYYVEQRYNGIYEVPEEDFNLIKSYIK